MTYHEVKKKEAMKRKKMLRYPILNTVLPRDETIVDPSILEIDKQISGLDTLLQNVNLKIAEQHGELYYITL